MSPISEPKPRMSRIQMVGHPSDSLEQQKKALSRTHVLRPGRATQCRTHNVAANFRSFRDVAGVSRYIPHTPPKKTLSHPSCHLPVTVSRGNFLAKTDRATGGV